MNGMPKIEEKLKKKEARFKSSKNLLVMKWMDKKEIYMIASMNTEDFAPLSRKETECAETYKCYRLCYNKLMGK